MKIAMRSYPEHPVIDGPLAGRTLRRVPEEATLAFGYAEGPSGPLAGPEARAAARRPLARYRLFLEDDERLVWLQDRK